MQDSTKWLNKSSFLALLCSGALYATYGSAIAAPTANGNPEAVPPSAAPTANGNPEAVPTGEASSQDVPDPTEIPSSQGQPQTTELALPKPPKSQLLPGGFHPGPMLKWRQQLKAQINEAAKRGVGVKNYRVAFDDLEKLVEAGAPESDIKAKIVAILVPLHQQMRSGQYLKTFTPEKPPPASPPLLAPAGEAEKAFRLASVQVPVSQLEQAMFSYVNQDRSQNGLPALSFSSTLSGVARQHSDDMCKRNFFAHVNPDGTDPQGRARNNGISVGVAENICLVSDRGNQKAMIQQAEVNLMNSPGHRANILNSGYRCVGIGVSFDKMGALRVTQLFSSESI